jgi:hypothetical protein
MSSSLKNEGKKTPTNQKLTGRARNEMDFFLHKKTRNCNFILLNQLIGRVFFTFIRVYISLFHYFMAVCETERGRLREKLPCQLKSSVNHRN